MKKDLTSSAYWFAFGEMTCHEKPTPKEAADYVCSLHITIDKLNRELAESAKREKLIRQEFDLFALKVSNMANQHRDMILSGSLTQ